MNIKSSDQNHFYRTEIQFSLSLTLSRLLCHLHTGELLMLFTWCWLKRTLKFFSHFRISCNSLNVVEFLFFTYSNSLINQILSKNKQLKLRENFMLITSWSYDNEKFELQIILWLMPLRRWIFIIFLQKNFSAIMLLNNSYRVCEVCGNYSFSSFYYFFQLEADSTLYFGT